jgi:hypothetical protein
MAHEWHALGFCFTAQGIFIPGSIASINPGWKGLRYTPALGLIKPTE